ncbi:MAG: hypothetical protein ACYCZX_00250 [Rhodospirillaceae bacterium]
MSEPRRKKSAPLALPAAKAEMAAALRATEMVQTPGPLVDHAGHSLDICSSMFDVCRHCQETHLDRLGAACMFDVDGGEVPAWMFQVLRAIVEMVVADIAAGVKGRVAGSAVGVTLRRSGAFWALAIAENLSGDAGAKRAARRLTMVRALTDRLECVCRILPNAWGSTIAIAFPADRAEASTPPARVLH